MKHLRTLLIDIGAVSEESIEIFATSTRDVNDLKVYRDNLSGVIFIDDYYCGESEYKTGSYREEQFSRVTGYEDIADSERRFERYKKFICAKSVCDFGCGAGDFLKLASQVASDACGVELQDSFRKHLQSLNVNCVANLHDLGNKSYDVVTLFHVLEHLPEPRVHLKTIYDTLLPSGKGKVIIEVPHANDFLLQYVSVPEFVKFTLWSQHLVLHTRDSLRRLLADVGFKNIVIEGVQRYPLSNHLQWLKSAKPGGHKSALSVFETEELTHAYATALAKIDATDTLVAIATT